MCRIAAAGRCFADLITGRISFYSGPSTEVLPQIRAGKVRAIAVLTEKRIKQLPDVATSAEQGFGKYIGSSWSSIVVPAKTPDSVVEKISSDIAAPSKIRASAPSWKSRAQSF